MVDATTAIEDKTFWDNSGFDPIGFVAAAIDTLNGRDRGGSTITQQLVRARLLPESAFTGGIYERKAKEIIQSIRLTEAYPGIAGKQAIMEKYLNQNFYGNRSYGVGAAARSYWKKDLKDLTLAESALLAGIPQSPTKFDLVRNAVQETYTDDNGVEQVPLVVPANSEIVIRRNFILDLMKTRSVLSGSRHTEADYEAAKQEPVILASQAADQWRAPQFVWQVRDELGQLLCGDCPVRADRHGRIPGHHDPRLPHAAHRREVGLCRRHHPQRQEPGHRSQGPRHAQGRVGLDQGPPWPQHPQRRRRRDGLQDRRGARLRRLRLLHGQGERRSSSRSSTSSPTAGASPARPSSRSSTSIGIDDQTMTAATMFMDVSPTSRRRVPSPTPRPRRTGSSGVPCACATPSSSRSTSPPSRPGFLNGLEHQFERTKDFGLRYQKTAVPVVSESIGTLVVHPIDLISAFGMIGNGGVLMPRHTILKVLDATGNAGLAAARRHARRGARRVARGRLRHHRHPARATRSSRSTPSGRSGR